MRMEALGVVLFRCAAVISVLSLAACGGGDDDDNAPPPTISTFQAQNATATAGIGTSLTFTFSGGTGVVDNGVGNVVSGTPAFVTPASTTNYRLTVTNADGETATATTTVTVVPMPVINWLEATPSTVRPGDNVTLTASFGGGTGTVSGPGGNLGTMTSNVAFATPVAENSTFTLTVTSPAGVVLTRSVDVSTSRFTATGRMQFGRIEHLANLLEDGRALVLGGRTEGGVNGVPEARAEIYDPATGQFTAAGELDAGFEPVSSTVLDDGSVLVVSDTQARIYDPSTGTFAPTGSPLESRRGHRAVLLEDGRVLLVGGAGTSAQIDKTAELYDPATGDFSHTAGEHARNAAMFNHSVVRLNSGEVLICGGYDGSNGPSATPQCELFDPATGTFQLTDSMSRSRTLAAMSLLPDGRVLIAGVDPEIYDPTTETFSPATALPSVRVCRANTLSDGNVLLVGVTDPQTQQALPNLLFDPVASATEEVGDMVTSRDSCDYPVVALPEGRALITGGHENSPPIDYATAEVFH